MLRGFGFGVAAFAHVVVRALGDQAVRRRLWREVGAQLVVTVALSVVLAFLLRRIPLLKLGPDLLPRIVWEKNAATVALCVAFFIEWVVAFLWPARTRLCDDVARAAGLAEAPLVRSPRDEIIHRARALLPLFAICALWTVALLGAAWVGLHALAPRASDPVRLAATAVAAAFVVILPALPVLGTWVWFVADRVGRAAEPPLGARELLARHPGEVLGLALCALPSALPLTHLVWRPFVSVTAALLRRTRLDQSMALPPGLKADPLEDLFAQVRLGVAQLRAGTVDAPAHPGRVARLLWAPSLMMGAARAALLDAEGGARVRRVLGLQVLAFAVVSAAWFSLFGFEIEDHQIEGTNFRVGFGGTFVAALFSLLHFTEAIVIALSREHHDAISARASVLVGVPPDEDVSDPRVRLDRKWLWRRLKRRAQGGLILVVSALPWVILTFVLIVPIVKLLEDAVLVGWFLRVAVSAVGNAVVLCFGLYWGAVFLVGKTSFAWTQETTREPFFLEALARLSERHPRAAWPIAVYLWVVRRTLGIVPRPAALMERVPMEAIGLALVRLTCLVPGVYLVLRPFFPVGAALLLKHRAPECIPAVVLAIPAAAEATSGHTS